MQGGRGELIIIPIPTDYDGEFADASIPELIIAGGHLMEELYDLHESMMKLTDPTQRNKNIIVSIKNGCDHQRVDSRSPRDVLVHLKNLFNSLNKIGGDITVIDEYQEVDEICTSYKKHLVRLRAEGTEVKDEDDSDDDAAGTGNTKKNANLRLASVHNSKHSLRKTTHTGSQPSLAQLVASSTR